MNADRSRQIVADKLKDVRREKRLTQDEVAQKGGISTNYYARVERGEVTPTLERFEKILHGLQVKSSDVLPF
jgi:transcriptional regulator with XRE-family HTH domain